MPYRFGRVSDKVAELSDGDVQGINEALEETEVRLVHVGDFFWFEIPVGASAVPSKQVVKEMLQVSADTQEDHDARQALLALAKAIVVDEPSVKKGRYAA